jgi:hypothetical protein
MIERTEERLDLKPDRLAADTAYGTGNFLGWLMGTGITPHIPVWEGPGPDDATFTRHDFVFDASSDTLTCPGGNACSDIDIRATSIGSPKPTPGTIGPVRSIAVPAR